MTINSTLINTAVDIVQEVFSSQTSQDIQNIKQHFGNAYHEGKLMSEIVTKLVLRIGNIENRVDVRMVSPVDDLVDHVEEIYRSRFGS